MRLAAQESVINCLQLTILELETLERLREYLRAVKEEQDAGLAIFSAQLDDVTSVIEARGLQNIEDDGEFYRTAYADELITLSISNAQLNQAREYILSWPGFCSVPGVGTDSVDCDDQDLDEEEEEEKEELLGDPFPMLPSSKPSKVCRCHLCKPLLVIYFILYLKHVSTYTMPCMYRGLNAILILMACELVSPECKHCIQSFVGCP